MEQSTTPLMLTGIPGADFTLTRDYIVMQDDQVNVINSLKNPTLSLGDNHITNTSEKKDITKESNSQSITEANAQMGQINKILSHANKKKAVDKKNTKKSKQQMDDDKNFCKLQIFVTTLFINT